MLLQHLLVFVKSAFRINPRNQKNREEEKMQEAGSISDIQRQMEKKMKSRKDDFKLDELICRATERKREQER